MTPTELRLFAERCRDNSVAQNAAIWRGCSPHEWEWSQEQQEEMARYCLEASRCVDYVLSTVREDDGEQVSRKHLEELGFYRPMQVASADCYVWPSEDTTAPKAATYIPLVSIEFVRGKFGVLTTIVSVYGYAKEHQKYTVGQLRRLLEGLGLSE